MTDTVDAPEVPTPPVPAALAIPDPDYAAFLAWKAGQPRVISTPEVPEELRAPEWDSTDDADVPMIVYVEKDMKGNPERVHRVKVSDWSAYERRHNL